MGWFRRKPVPEPAPELDEVEEVAEEIPEEEPLGPFDQPYRIRSRAQLDAEFSEPLPDDAAARAMQHSQQSQQAKHEAEGPVDWIEGIDWAEVFDPTYQQYVVDHEQRIADREYAKALQTPFIKKMVSLQSTVLRWKQKVEKIKQ
jgi:hypothetical protein